MHPEGADSLAPGAEPGSRDLIANQHYWIREHRQRGGDFELSGSPGPRVLMVMSGSASVAGLALQAGSTAVVPACAIDAMVEVDADVVYLEIGLGV